MSFASIRRATGLTQVELAANLGVGQAQVSKLERQDDMLISTLASYLAALGASAEIVVLVGGADDDVRSHRRKGDAMTTQTEITQKNHRRAVRFFWCFLIGATAVSLVGNVAHAVLPYVPQVVIQIGAAAVPPIALLAAVHGIALAVRAGASGRIYRWAVAAVALIGVGAFAVSFLALRDLMHAIGYSPATAWIFPAIIDTTVASAR